jgi:uncharacterized RDD family membrane protein YckC
MHRAGMFPRIAATLLDLALFLPLYFAAVFLVTRIYGRPGDRMWDVNPVRISATVGNGLWLIYSSLEWIKGATPGKLLLGMRIDSAAGEPATRGRLFLRWALKQSPRICGLLDAATVSANLRLLLAKTALAFFYHEPMNVKYARDLGELLAFALLAGFLLILLPGGLALHDRLTNTAVYRKPLPTAKRGFDPVTTPIPAQPLESA